MPITMNANCCVGAEQINNYAIEKEWLWKYVFRNLSNTESSWKTTNYKVTSTDTPDSKNNNKEPKMGLALWKFRHKWSFSKSFTKLDGNKFSWSSIIYRKVGTNEKPRLLKGHVSLLRSRAFCRYKWTDEAMPSDSRPEQCLLWESFRLLLSLRYLTV